MFDRNLNMTAAFFACKLRLNKEDIENIFLDDDKIKVNKVRIIHRFRLPSDDIETTAVVQFEDKNSLRLAISRYDGTWYDFKEKGIHELFLNPDAVTCPVQ